MAAATRRSSEEDVVIDVQPNSSLDVVGPLRVIVTGAAELTVESMWLDGSRALTTLCYVIARRENGIDCIKISTKRDWQHDLSKIVDLMHKTVRSVKLRCSIMVGNQRLINRVTARDGARVILDENYTASFTAHTRLAFEARNDSNVYLDTKDGIAIGHLEVTLYGSGELGVTHNNVIVTRHLLIELNSSDRRCFSYLLEQIQCDHLELKVTKPDALGFGGVGIASPLAQRLFGARITRAFRRAEEGHTWREWGKSSVTTMRIGRNRTIVSGSGGSTQPPSASPALVSSYSSRRVSRTEQPSPPITHARAIGLLTDQLVGVNNRARRRVLRGTAAPEAAQSAPAAAEGGVEPPAAAGVAPPTDFASASAAGRTRRRRGRSEYEEEGGVAMHGLGSLGAWDQEPELGDDYVFSEEEEEGVDRPLVGGGDDDEEGSSELSDDVISDVDDFTLAMVGVARRTAPQQDRTIEEVLRESQRTYQEDEERREAKQRKKRHISGVHRLAKALTKSEYEALPDEKEVANRCAICLLKTKDHMCYPCGHVTSCNKCTHKLARRWRKDKQTCPICREKIGFYGSVGRPIVPIY